MCRFSFGLLQDFSDPQTHHDDADTDADPADDVQSVVEHLVDGSRTALTEQQNREDILNYIVLGTENQQLVVVVFPKRGIYQQTFNLYILKNQ